nr:response regulator [Parvularcula dongshanensis]
MLLEDSDLDADLTGEYLRLGGIVHRFHRVWSRETFVDALRSGRRFDLLLVDYVLPSFDGLSALKIAQAHCPDTPFIFLSGTLGEEVAINALKQGATDYVSKQRLNALCPAVTRAVDEAAQRTARRHAEGELRELNRTLEARVAERTRELREAKERLEAEAAERERVEVQLRHAQKIEALGKLTGGVAHDFNNLLQVISGNLDLLTQTCGNDEKARARLSAAKAGVERGAKLAQQLLAFGRRQPLRPRVLDIGQLVIRQQEILQRTLGGDVTILSDVPGDLWNTFVDSSQLENALLNLAINARDAMLGGGNLTIRVRNVTLRDTEREDAVTPGEYVRLSVRDNGTGMPPDVLAQVLEPFFTTKAEGHGTGLGLSMVYGFVKQSGGYLTIESEVGTGTTVTVDLPRSHEAAKTLEAPAEDDVVGGDETILLVEDNDAVRQTVSGMIEELGYTVIEAGDAAKALALLREGHEIDLLFTDVVMPGPVTSQVLAAEAQRFQPGLPVLFTSGYTQGAMMPSGHLATGIRLLDKPYTRDSLARALRDVLDTKGVDSEPDLRLNRDLATASATILLVEDEPLIRMLAADMLEETGYEVVEAHSFATGRDAVERSPIDLLITDLGLPDGSGIDLAKDLRLTRPTLPVVFATGQPDRAFLEELGTPHAQVLSKPFDKSALVKAVVNGLSAKSEC